MIFLDENGSRLEARGTGFNVKNVILSVAKNPGRVFLIAVLVAACASFAAKKKDAEEQARIQDSLKQVEIQNLQREIESLARIRLQKADSLEKLEAAHWSKRYAESQLTEEHRAQLLNYLRLTKCKMGLLVNFASYPKATVEQWAL